MKHSFRLLNVKCFFKLSDFFKRLLNKSMHHDLMFAIIHRPPNQRDLITSTPNSGKTKVKDDESTFSFADRQKGCCLRRTVKSTGRRCRWSDLLSPPIKPVNRFNPGHHRHRTPVSKFGSDVPIVGHFVSHQRCMFVVSDASKLAQILLAT